MAIVKIKYKKSEDEQSERYIVPVDPFEQQNVKGIDVTHLAECQRLEVSETYEEYSAYLRQHMKQAFSYEDWLLHSKDIEFTPSWRTFKPSKTEILS